MKNSANYVSGYFLNETSDVVVLALSSFDAQPPYSAQFQTNIADFLARCKSANKKKLIIDTRGNRGGTVLLAYDTFRQLFPSLVPYSGNRLRVSEAVSIAAQIGSLAGSLLAGTFFDALTSLQTPDGLPFQSYNQLYGHIGIRSDNFSHVAAKEFGNATIDEEQSGIVVSRYANNSAIPSQAFRGEDIILVSSVSPFMFIEIDSLLYIVYGRELWLILRTLRKPPYRSGKCTHRICRRVPELRPYGCHRLRPGWRDTSLLYS
jgi:hypothetical protein